MSEYLFATAGDNCTILCDQVSEMKKKQHNNNKKQICFYLCNVKGKLF